MDEREIPKRELPDHLQAPGNLDAMPHVHRRAQDGALMDEAGNVIPPAQQSGRAGTDDVTWEAGIPHRAPGADESDL